MFPAEYIKIGREIVKVAKMVVPEPESEVLKEVYEEGRVIGKNQMQSTLEELNEALEKGHTKDLIVCLLASEMYDTEGEVSEEWTMHGRTLSSFERDKLTPMAIYKYMKKHWGKTYKIHGAPFSRLMVLQYEGPIPAAP